MDVEPQRNPVRLKVFVYGSSVAELGGRNYPSQDCDPNQSSDNSENS